MFALASISAAQCQATELPDGLAFGRHFSEVEAVVVTNGWELQKSIVSGWNVPAANITLYFCNEHLASIDQREKGSLHLFVETVQALRLKHGKPETDVFVMAARDPLETHGIQSVFKSDDGLRISVQIYTRQDGQTLFTRTSKTAVCEPQ